MISNELLKILVCPETRSPLKLADGELVSRINALIARRELRSRGGQTLEKALDGGLLRTDGRVLYPIVDEIPMLLIDDSIPMDQPGLNSV